MAFGGELKVLVGFDAEGNIIDYSLVVSKTATLVFSYIGYISQEIPVGEKNMINVSLVEDSKTLSEVAVSYTHLLLRQKLQKLLKQQRLLRL